MRINLIILIINVALSNMIVLILSNFILNRFVKKFYENEKQLNLKMINSVVEIVSNKLNEK